MFSPHWVASSTWTTNMLRLDPTFNSDLPESKRWLKEYGARENEAFRFQDYFFDEFYMFRLAMAQIRDLVFGVVSYFFLCSGNTLCQVRRMTDEKL